MISQVIAVHNVYMKIKIYNYVPDVMLNSLSKLDGDEQNTLSIKDRKQVDITISKNQVLQMLYSVPCL